MAPEMKKEPAVQASNVQFACALAATMLAIGFAAAICPAHAAGAPLAQVSKNETDRVRDKLRHIIIPELEFKDTTFEKAVEELQKACVDYDTTSLSGNRGVTIWMGLDEPYPPNFMTRMNGDVNEAERDRICNKKITLSLKNVSLEEALRKITQQAGMTFRVLPNLAVTILSPAAEEDYSHKLITREFEIPTTAIFKNVQFPPTAKIKTVLGKSDSPLDNLMAVTDTQEHLDELSGSMSDAEVKERKALDEKANPPPPPELKHIHDKLEHIIIPRFAIKENTLSDALDFLRQKSVELDTTETDPERKGVNIVNNDFDPKAHPPKITLSLKNVPLSVALDSVAYQAGLKCVMEPKAGSVVLDSYQADDFDPLITKEYKVPAPFFKDREGHSQTPQEFFESTGVVSFPPGSAVTYLPEAGILVARNTGSYIDTITRIVETILPPNPNSGDTNLEKERKAFIREKLDKIIIPKIDFKDVSVMEAVDFLNKRIAETDAAHKGVTISIAAETGLTAKQNPTSTDKVSIFPALPADEKLTLSLTNIPLGVALDYITKLANRRLKVSPQVVDVFPMSGGPEVLQVKVYKVPVDYPREYDFVAQETGKHTSKKVTPQEHLEGERVPFPDGAYAKLLPIPGLLAVRNTRDNVEAIDTILNSEREDYAVAAKEKAEALKSAPVQKKGTPFSVLANFQIRVTGYRIHLIDADGSIYTGTIITEPGLFAPSYGSTFKNVAEKSGYQYKPAPDSPVRVFVTQFQASGVNITTNEPVVIDGIYFPGVYRQEKAGVAEPAAAYVPKMIAAQVTNARIRGRALAGSETFTIDAAVVSPGPGKSK